MKLGGTITGHFKSAADWGKQLEMAHFTAATCPLPHNAPVSDIAEMLSEASRLHVTIAEVGVWRNPISPDTQERDAALAYAKDQLAYADAIGATCCVNITGSCGARWDGAYQENYSAQTYAEVVRSIQEIIDAVRPTQTFYTIEPMPWMIPDGPEQYLQLIQDVNRERFAVHMDFVNMINSINRYLFSNDFIEECFSKLGPYIKSCHIKDVALEVPFTMLLREVPPGKGQLDYAHVLRTIDRYLPKDIPVLLEHMQTNEEYTEAFAYVSAIAKQEKILI